MSLSVHYRIQSVVGREALVERLLPGLPTTVEVIVDDGVGASPWKCYEACLTDIPACSHVVVIQDDCILCRNFPQAVEKVVEDRPESVIQLWTGGLGGKTRADYLDAMSKGQRFSPVHQAGIHHVVAVVWPRSLAESFIEWTKEAKLPGRPPRSDDAIVGLWAKKTKTQIWASVPSIVEHDEEVLSTIRKYSHGHRGRIAIAWVGTETDPCSFDWSET